MFTNIILQTDSYKFSHAKQYPPNTTKVYSYFESRGGEFPATVFFGLQYYLKHYLEGVRVTKEKIDEAEAIINEHMGRKMFNRVGWEHILTHHAGRLPVSIRAVPEGTLVPTQNVLMTIENTDPACWWLTNYLETMLVQTWYPTTVCTLSYNIKKLIGYYLDRTGDPAGLPFKFHDFGYRGVSSQESAAIGGAAHLVNFMGTDTVAGLMLAREFYGAGMAGYSIPAAEHSTITSWGKEHEVDAFANMLEQYPEGLVAVVSDSFDIFNACSDLWGKQLRDRVLSRNGTVVIRPDSGEPTIVVCKVLDLLGQAFGYEENDKGYKVLNPHVRIIQGDGIDYGMTKDILTAMRSKDWSADNIAFGCGGSLLQKLNRDTQSFAFKCSFVEVNGEQRDVYKDPITDNGKVSKRGRLKLITKQIGGKPGGYITMRADQETDELVEVFRDGKVLVEWTFDDVRKRSASFT
jgi:nicotinamide phosphoribosyltransferase